MVTLPEVPIVETDRLRMRSRTAEGFSYFAEMWADERVTRHITKQLQNPSEIWGKFLRTAGHWLRLGHGYWVVETKGIQDFVGEIGFGEFKRDIDPSIFCQPEVGWVLAPSSQGNGYATEAARAAIAREDESFEGGKMSCIIEPANIASIRVAEECGFTESFRTFFMEEELSVLYRKI